MSLESKLPNIRAVNFPGLWRFPVGTKVHARTREGVREFPATVEKVLKVDDQTRIFLLKWADGDVEQRLKYEGDVRRNDGGSVAQGDEVVARYVLGRKEWRKAKISAHVGEGTQFPRELGDVFIDWEDGQRNDRVKSTALLEIRDAAAASSCVPRNADEQGNDVIVISDSDGDAKQEAEASGASEKGAGKGNSFGKRSNRGHNASSQSSSSHLRRDSASRLLQPRNSDDEPCSSSSCSSRKRASRSREPAASKKARSDSIMTGISAAAPVGDGTGSGIGLAMLNIAGLHSMVARDDLTGLKRLLRHRESEEKLSVLNERNPETGLTAVGVYASMSKANRAVLDVLVGHGADPAKEGVNQFTPLMRACERQDGRKLTVVQQLMDLEARGIAVGCEKREFEGNTAVHIALRSDDSDGIKIAQLLIRSGKFDLEARDKPMDNEASSVFGMSDGGETALMYAVRFERTAVVKELLAYGVDVNAANDRGYTGVEIAAKLGCSAELHLLLRHEYLDLSVSMCENALEMARKTRALVTESLSKGDKMLPELQVWAQQRYWQPNRMQMELWLENTATCVADLEERLSELKEMEARIVDGKSFLEVVTLNEACRRTGHNACRTTEFSDAALTVFYRETQKEAAGGRRLPDMRDKPDSARNIRWTTEEVDSKVYRWGDSETRTIKTVRQKVLDEGVRRSVLAYGRHAGHHPNIKIVVLGVAHRAFVEGKPCFGVVAARNLREGEMLTEYVGVVRTQQELEDELTQSELDLLQHEFNIAETEDWEDHLIITSNPGFGKGIRSMGMMVNDPRIVLDQPERTQTVKDARRGAREIVVKSVKALFGANLRLIPVISIGENNHKVRVFAVDGTSNTIQVEPLQNPVKKGEEVIQHCNVNFQSLFVDGVPRVYVRADEDIAAGEELMGHYGVKFWEHNSKAVLQQQLDAAKAREEKERREKERERREKEKYRRMLQGVA